MRLSVAGSVLLTTGLWLVCLLSQAQAVSSNATEIEPPPPMPVPAAAQPHPDFDVKAAVDAYLATIPADKKARSDAYFEGGYWLLLWDFLYGGAVLILLLKTGWSARMRDFAERATRFKPLQTMIYFAQFLLIAYVLQFPLTVYEGFFREHKYDLLNQTFAQWFRDQVVGLVLGIVLGGIAIAILFGLVRRLGKNWWIWGACASVVLFGTLLLVAPVFIAPLFNTYTKLNNPKVKDPILSMARASGIPVTDVYQVDESRQSNRVSANVSGFLGTERITLNDNLLRRCSLPAIESTMGHEMGHYVLNHSWKGLMFLAILNFVGFAFLNRSLNWSLARWSERWGIRNVTDLAALPVAALLLSIFFFVMTPALNTFTRTQEYEADLYGINAGAQPDGEAEVDLLLGEYRKLDPSPIEEFIFFDHPSGRTRITAAMRWKKEHMTAEASSPSGSIH